MSGVGSTFTVVWQSYGQDGSGWGVFGQRYSLRSSTGSKATDGSQFQVNTYTTNNQVTPRVAMDDGGDFVVTWASFGEGNNKGYGVYAQQLHPGRRRGRAASSLVNPTRATTITCPTWPWTPWATS